MVGSLGNQPPPLGEFQKSLYQPNKIYLYSAHHLGNYKGFRSSVPGTVNEDQMYILYYKLQYHNYIDNLYVHKFYPIHVDYIPIYNSFNKWGNPKHNILKLAFLLNDGVGRKSVYSYSMKNNTIINK